MLKELHTAAIGMLNTQTRLEVTANNIANASTVGFKRAGVFERNLIDAKSSLFNNPAKLEQADPPIGSYIEWRPGGYNNTANPLDLAIDGAGFFITKDLAGDMFLTRSGSFKLSPEGFVITPEGRCLVGINEEVIRIPDYKNIDGGDATSPKSSVNITVSNTGNIYANDVSIGTIQLVEADDYSQLTRVDRQSFITNNNTIIKKIPEELVHIKQGWLENSNVDIINEMVTMIELQRAFEAGSKIIQTSDSTIEKTIQTSKFGYY